MRRRIGQYLMDCLSNVGVDKVFGVPGDFNLTFLDDIIGRTDMEWIGNTNELNASYAADGYARMKGISAMVTTFGVGELSAVNGIAGAFAERVPVIQITGAPTQAVEQAGKYVHHSLGEGNFDDYRKMYEPITTTQAYITEDNAQLEIPRVINAALTESRPVHIHLPIDVAAKEIEVMEDYHYKMSKPADVSQYIDMVQAKLNSAERPVIITGHEINSFGLHELLEQFVNQTGIPVAQLSLGKGAFNEESPYYMGIYDGSIAEERIKYYVDHSDAILNIGAKLTDSATAGFSYQFDIDDVIMLNHRNFKMNETRDDNVALQDLLICLQSIDFHFNGDYPMFKKPVPNDDVLDDTPLTQQTYFKMMQDFLNRDDVVIAEQGTSFFGAYDLALTKTNKFIGQPLWGSIGYTLPATLGSQLADGERRNVLLIGDGSLQLTVQEMATMIRLQLKPVIFIINNDGYTVERKIHGENALYNDIPMWDYKALPSVFGGNETVSVHEVDSSVSLQHAFNEINLQPNRMHVIEVKMGMHDAPEKLNDIGKAFAKQNG